MFTAFLFLVGLVLLVWGADVLVRGASELAIWAGISPLVVGLTVVAYGTSAPELAVTVNSSFTGNPDIAIGNVVGSNIANLLLVLGLVALISPLPVSRVLVWRGLPVMIGVSLLVLLFGLDGVVSRGEGTLLFAGSLLYTYVTVRQSRLRTQARRAESLEPPPPVDAPLKQIALRLLQIVVGLAMLVLGSHWLVAGAVTLAEMLGVSQLVIGLTVVAVGTSLPEVATSLVAGVRDERDLAVGNAVGSNIFNVLMVLGLCAVVAPGGVPVAAQAIQVDIPIMLVVAVICLPLFATGYQVTQLEGALMLGYYGAYNGFIYLTSTNHPWLPSFQWQMAYLVIPATALLLVVRWVRAWKKQPV